MYQSLLRLTWVDKLLANIRSLFIQRYKDQLKAPLNADIIYDFDDYFERQLQKLETETERSDTLPSKPDTGEELTPPSSSDNELGLEAPRVPELRRGMHC